MNNKPMIIIGAGASGLIAAITVGRAGHKAILLEQNSKIGKKILGRAGASRARFRVA